MSDKIKRGDKLKICDMLGIGEENARTQEELKNVLGYSDKRAVRNEVEVERRDGHVILSSAAGYYLPANNAEVRRYVKGCEKRLKKSFITLRTAKNYLDEVDGQVKMELSDESDKEGAI